MTYSWDFREANLAYKKKGHTIQQICETFNISKKNIQPLSRSKTKNRQPTTKKTQPQKRKINPKNSQYLEEHPDAYLKEIAKQFNCKDSFGV